MFEVIFPSASFLKYLMEAIKELTNECAIEVSSTGISLQAMDSSHVSLITFNLKREGFDSYRCDRPLTLGLNLKTITKLLKTASAEDRATLRAEDDGDQLKIILESGTRCTVFDVKLVETSEEVLQVSVSDAHATIKMRSEELKQICHNLQALGDAVSIEVNKDTVNFSVAATDTSCCISVRPSTATEEETNGTEITVREPMTLSFALRLLTQFTKATPLSPRVVLELHPEQPMCCTYELGEDANLGSLRYYLAPKIADEEEEAKAEDGNETVPATNADDDE